MSAGYKAVLWNRQKIIYDAVLLVGVALFVLGYMEIAPRLDPNAEAMNVEIRAFGLAAFILLHIILSIGPLCRLDARLLPLLYNRRHMGVTMCLLGIQHARLATTWYHDFGNLDPWVSLLVSNTRIGSLTQFPFEWLGLAALAILIVMAVTSHDFWLANLTAPVWKALHMGVYFAYALLVGHVALGALQSDTGAGLTLLVLAGAGWIVAIHLAAALKERAADRPTRTEGDGWVLVGPVDAIPDDRARVVFASGERIAVFKYDGRLSAISGVCQHQNGPLGEGCIIDGLVTCPWHGYQYDPATGASPPPFQERIPTFDVIVRGGLAYVNPAPHPAGTRVAPAQIPGDRSA